MLKESKFNPCHYKAVSIETRHGHMKECLDADNLKPISFYSLITN